MTQLPDLLTARQAGEMLGGVSDETLNRWARQDKIPCITLPSGQRRFRRSDIEAILSGRRPASTAAA